MRQTLFTIPHSWFEGPLLIAWLILGAVYLLYLWKRHGSDNETWSFVLVYAVVSFAIYFVFPGLESTGINPADPTGPEIKTGLAVRGYGLFLLLGIVCGVVISILRCRYIGLTPDQILGLAFCMMLSGILGARLFYVVQKPEEFFVEGVSPIEVVRHVVDMTKGGLVVYGSLIFGTMAGLVYLVVNKMPVLKTADLIAPGMVLGLALGRIGCLMNGCCFGGVCPPELPNLTFPAGSGPYMQQLYRGELLGIQPRLSDSDDGIIEVDGVAPGSIAERLGVQADDQVAVSMPSSLYIRHQKSLPDQGSIVGEKELVGYVESSRQGSLTLPVSDLPDRSLGTHPTQVYSSINAALLCLVLWFYWTIRKADGEVFGLMLIFYSIARFLLEMIRRDEAGQFGTSLTISQWVSLAVILVGFACFAYARTRREEAPISSAAV